MPSATDRGSREHLARRREDWEAGKAETGKPPFDWQQIEVEARTYKHFSPLSDSEWSAIRLSLYKEQVHISDEKVVREAIDVETLASGAFAQFSIATTPDRSKATEWIRQQFKLADKLEKLVPELREYLGPMLYPFGDDAYDPHREVRGFDKATVAFVEHLRGFAKEKLEQLDEYPEPLPNAKRKPENDRWGVGLIEVWSKILDQPIENSVALQRFMVACASPYGWLASTTSETAERQARYFIDRYLAGEVKTWPHRRTCEEQIHGIYRFLAKPDK